MRYFALATDYDGTLATHGGVDAETIHALERFVATGRKLVLVTGRQIEDLERVFSGLHLFAKVVGENGAVLYTPASKELRVLEEPPPQGFASALRARGVEPLSVGHVVVATWEPHQAAVLDVIRAMGLELHVEFNKGAVMVLPAGVTKRSGLSCALAELRLSPHNVVGVGDAENDHSFLTYCECGVSVANAVASLKTRSDWVTPASHGAGVAQLIGRVLDDDLRSVTPAQARRRVVLGKARGRGGLDVSLPPHDACVLLTGPSGSGKSSIATAFVERLAEMHYQLCVIDPEGDHQELAWAAVVGDARHAPTVDEVMHLLDDPTRSAVATLLAVPMEDRTRWFSALLSRVREMRAAVGRPHWLVVDEAHHVAPAARDVGAQAAGSAGDAILLTVDPASVSRSLLAEVDTVVATPGGVARSLGAFAGATGRAMPEVPPEVGDDAMVIWRVREAPPVAVDVPVGRTQRLRHKRKYAQGELGEDKSFWFRGPAGALRLRAQNLALFVQIADGVDDATWLHHLRACDYSRWFRDSIKDDQLADEVASIEAHPDAPPRETRAQIRAAIEARYTLPAA